MITNTTTPTTIKRKGERTEGRRQWQTRKQQQQQASNGTSKQAGKATAMASKQQQQQASNSNSKQSRSSGGRGPRKLYWPSQTARERAGQQSNGTAGNSKKQARAERGKQKTNKNNWGQNYKYNKKYNNNMIKKAPAMKQEKQNKDNKVASKDGILYPGKILTYITKQW